MHDAVSSSIAYKKDVQFSRAEQCVYHKVAPIGLFVSEALHPLSCLLCFRIDFMTTSLFIRCVVVDISSL